jgi:exodeoxyribonuclease V alpha subunit
MRFCAKRTASFLLLAVWDEKYHNVLCSNSALPSAMAEINGTIAQVVHENSTDHYVVIQMASEDFSTFKAVGVMPAPQKDLDVTLYGDWRKHPTYGDQFNFTSYRIAEPVGRESVIGFLVTLQGIGKRMAARIVDHFGDGTFQILEREPERMLEVNGITSNKLEKMLQSYSESRKLQNLIAFLAGLGITATYAGKIYREFGDESINTIKKDPYLLIERVRGFGFKRADDIALKTGISIDSAIRYQSAIADTLRQAAKQQGHCFLPQAALIRSCADLLRLPGHHPQAPAIIAHIQALCAPNAPDRRRLVVENTDVYLCRAHQAEYRLAENLQSLCGTFKVKTDIGEWVAKYEADNDIELATGQKEALTNAVTQGVTIMTGGAGVGKTATAKAIIEFWLDHDQRVVACAPTGKAALRIQESTGLEAQTIHRLLGWMGTGFSHNSRYPLEGDCFIIDEASMLDLAIADALVAAIPLSAQVLFIGDVNQLPSIAAGNVLRDMIQSEIFPVTKLTEVFRQAAASKITQCSYAVNDGKMPELEIVTKASEQLESDCVWIKCPANVIPKATEWLLREKLPALGYRQADIQYLAPMHKSDSGNIAINQLVQDFWNPVQPNKRRIKQFRVGDRVIQTSNDYNQLVFNGDIGIIESIVSKEEETITQIRYPDWQDPQGKLIEYSVAQLDNVMLAYSITIHKSQGSEFPVVVIPLSTDHHMMLQRNLLYTAITRGRRLVLLVGEERAMQQAVNTVRSTRRHTRLQERLQL